jgi:hypothetical protein
MDLNEFNLKLKVTYSVFENYFSLFFSRLSGRQEIKVAKKMFHHVSPAVFPHETSKCPLNGFS